VNLLIVLHVTNANQNSIVLQLFRSCSSTEFVNEKSHLHTLSPNSATLAS
jgi:hypothetical protein